MAADEEETWELPDGAVPGVEAPEDRWRWVWDTATEKDALALHKETLIGIFGKPANLRAILRAPDGTFLKVSTGDAAFGGRVHKISHNAVVIVKSGKSVLLRLRHREFNDLASLLQ